MDREQKDRDCRIRVSPSVHAAYKLLASLQYRKVGDLVSSLLAQILIQAYPKQVAMMDEGFQAHLDDTIHWAGDRIAVKRLEEEE